MIGRKKLILLIFQLYLIAKKIEQYSILAGDI